MLQALNTDLFPTPQLVLDYKKKGNSALMARVNCQQTQAECSVQGLGAFTTS